MLFLSIVVGIAIGVALAIAERRMRPSVNLRETVAQHDKNGRIAA